MTIRELLRVVPDDEIIKIAPNGRRTYFLGHGKGVPESLEAGEITEISLVLDEEKGFILGVRIADIKEWDLLYDKFGVADDVSYLTFDNGYYLQTSEEIETPKEFESLDDLATTIELLEKAQEEIEALRLGENWEKE